MTTDPQRPEVGDPRVLALAKARQQRAHNNPFNAGFCPPWDGLTEQEQRLSLLDARNYLRAAIDAGLVSAVSSPASAAQATPAGRDALRDRIAAALYAHDHPGHLVPLNETGMGPAYRESADAVMVVLRGLTLRELEQLYRPNTPPSRPEPRRMAVEAQQPGVPRCPACGHSICDGDGPCGARSGDDFCTCPGPAAEAQQQTETLPSIHANDVEGFCPACGHPTLRVGEDGRLTCTLMGCPNPDAANGLSYRLEAVLTERFTELGNPFSRMRIDFQGPDGWPASREVGPHDVAEVLRELLAATGPSAAVEEPAATETQAVCICGHPEQQHFEDVCLTKCGCGDFLTAEGADEERARAEAAIHALRSAAEHVRVGLAVGPIPLEVRPAVAAWLCRLADQRRERAVARAVALAGRQPKGARS